jgi:hypothetical protein
MRRRGRQMILHDTLPAWIICTGIFILLSVIRTRENMINKTIAIQALAVTIMLSAAGQGYAQKSKAVYSRMAPTAQYLMRDQEAEIALARSAAPAAVSGDATILVLKEHGYETAVKGKNGFVCAVERSWMGPVDSPEFWNPNMRGPVCFNPPAARSVLPITYKRTELALSGLSRTQLVASMQDLVRKKELPALEPGAMSYMMSREGQLGDAVGHWHPHLMFYSARSDGADWGADVAGSPVLLNPQFQGAPEPLATFIVRVPAWSDGTPGSGHTH